MEAVQAVLLKAITDVWSTFAENWPYLAIGVVFAAVLRTYVGSERIEQVLRGKTWMTVIGAVLLATFTPFCSCGTEAVVLSLMAGSVPWAPIVAFMVSSPLTSPEQLVLSGGLFGWPFALTYFIGATLLGIAAGFLTAWIEKRGWLAGQSRMRLDAATSGCGTACDSGGSGLLTRTRTAITTLLPRRRDDAGGCCTPGTPGTPEVERRPERVTVAANSVAQPCCDSTAELSQQPAPSGDVLVEPSLATRLKLRELATNIWQTARRILLFFFAFSAIGYLLIALIPSELFTGLLGGSSPYAVIVMALVGIPLYITTDGSLPLVASLLDAGMSKGAAMAFLITGAGTSVGAITGALIIARWRVVALVVGILLAGALLLGFGTQLTFDL